MDKETATEAIVPAIAPEEKVLPTGEDYEAKIEALEKEKAQLIENEANYKLAYLKEKSKRENPDPDETDDERFRRIAREEMAGNKISQIDTEKEELLKKLAKENKELKLAHLNTIKTPPADQGTHSEGQPVRDTLITPEQLAAFKARGWSDKDIERYKKNLIRYGNR